MGIRDKPIAPGSPWQNGFAERLIGSIRRECVDHVIALGEAHLRRILQAYARYYNDVRTNRSLDSRLTRLPSGKRAGHTDPPVYKEVRVFSGEPLEKAARAALRSCKALELPHHPVPKRKIDVSEQGIQGRWCVSSVVCNPTP